MQRRDFGAGIRGSRRWRGGPRVGPASGDCHQHRQRRIGIPQTALSAAQVTAGPVATLDGVVYRGMAQVEGGARAEARGILSTKREIKELREALDTERAAVEGLRKEIASLDVRVASADAAIASVQSELTARKGHRRLRSPCGARRRRRAGRATAEIASAANREKSCLPEARQRRRGLDRAIEEEQRPRRLESGAARF